MSATQREVLDRVARSSSAAHREVVRAKVLIAAADGVANTINAERHQVQAVTVRCLAGRVRDRRVAGLGQGQAGAWP